MEHIEKESESFQKYKEIVGNEFRRWLKLDKKNILRFMLSLSIAKQKGHVTFEDYKNIERMLED